MQIFIIGSALDTFNILDKRRLRKQLLESNQILRTLVGASEAWKNHPCILQYKDHIFWLSNYNKCLFHYINSGSNCPQVQHYNRLCEESKPYFHTEEFLNQMKRRLYTKDPDYYSIWSYLGISDENWYYVNNEMRIYKKGKRI